MLAGKLVVLTEEATAGTAREEYRLRTILADQRRFFAEMRSDGCNAKLRAFATKTTLPGSAVYTAAPRAKFTMAVVEKLQHRLSETFQVSVAQGGAAEEIKRTADGEVDAATAHAPNRLDVRHGMNAPRVCHRKLAPLRKLSNQHLVNPGLLPFDRDSVDEELATCGLVR